MRSGLPSEPQFGAADELQREPEPPRRNLLGRVLLAVAVAAVLIAWAPWP